MAILVHYLVHLLASTLVAYTKYLMAYTQQHITQTCFRLFLQHCEVQGQILLAVFHLH